MNKSYFVYIVASKSRVLYIGVTDDILRRVSEHKSGTFPGFSSRYNTTLLMHFEELPDIGEAIKREKQLKGWKRERKIALIEETNLDWADLSEGWYEEGQFERPGWKVRR